MLRRRSAELHINHERWLVSYADFVTLLFAFFVVMYAVSQMHENKYRELSETLGELFTAPETLEQGVTGLSVLESNQDATLNAPFSDTDAAHHNSVSESSSDENSDKKTIAQLPELAEQLRYQFSDLIQSDTIELSHNESWLQISLNNRILFPLGSVNPSRQAEAIFEEIAQLLKGYTNPIQVEGFTDNLTIRTEKFPSNWELSAARASAIVRLLIHYGMPAHHLAAVGYGELHPIADNSTAAGRAQNRRVTLLIGKHPRHRPKPSYPSPIKQISSEQKEKAIEGHTLTGTSQAEVNQSEELKSSATGNLGVEPITLKNGELLFTSDPKDRGQ